MVVLMYILAIIIILAATQVAQNLLPRIQSKHLMAYGAVAVYALIVFGSWQLAEIFGLEGMGMLAFGSSAVSLVYVGETWRKRHPNEP